MNSKTNELMPGDQEKRFGLKETVWHNLDKVFASCAAVDEVVLYGSRAKGNFKSGSDLDLTVKGEKLDLKTLNKLSLAIDDLLLPYTVDLSIYRQINCRELLDHINRVGKSIYRKA